MARGRTTAADRAAVWSPERSAALSAAFEEAATAALRAPVLAERSVLLRRVAKVVVPGRLRPAVRKIVGRLDAASRALTDAVGRRR